MKKQSIIIICMLFPLSLFGCTIENPENINNETESSNSINQNIQTSSHPEISDIKIETTLQVIDENNEKKIILTKTPENAKTYYTFNNSETDIKKFLEYKTPLLHAGQTYIVYYSKLGENIENIKKTEILSVMTKSIQQEVSSIKTSSYMSVNEKNAKTFINSIEIIPPTE